MLGSHRSRGAWRLAAPLAFAVGAVASCSGGSTPPVASSSSPVASDTASSSSGEAARSTLARAEATATATKSFRFVASEVLSGDTTHATVVRGNVVRAQGVSYVLTANGHTTQVVRIKGATYVRKVPGAWSRLRAPASVVDPIGSLLAVLRGLSGVALRQSGTAIVVTGQLSIHAAAVAQIPTSGSKPPQVAVTIDAAGHVTRVVVTTTARAGATAVTLTTTYGGFDAIAPLKAPA